MKVIRKPVESISENEKKQIDEFVENNYGTIFHETRFNIIASDVFKTKLTYFLAYENNKLIGICPCQTYKEKYLYLSYSNLSSYEIPYGGWIYSRDVSIKELLRKMKLKLNENLIYTSQIQINENVYDELNIIKPFKLNTVLVNLSFDIEEIFNVRINHKLRNKIRKARLLGVKIEKIQYKNINEFIDLSNELKNKMHLLKIDVDFYKKVMFEYEKDDKAVCLAAKHNNEYISAGILLANKNFTIGWVAGRKIEIQKNLYQNELLYWEAIVWAKNYGSKYFDLSGLDENKLAHLARIKLSFSKDVVPFYCFSKKSIFFYIINKLQNHLLIK